ncbi:MAG: protein translocase subunit SecD [Planctomycetota bacterium]|nr:protein translocase subunit SecD [Planctomycetota bacterium]
MPTKYTNRVLWSALALLISIWLIVPRPSRLFDHSLTPIQRTNLRPGIDMVGGVSLVYSIQAPAGSQIPDLANQVMEALKKRVDPNGLRNLVWRPQGNTRLEIQMPSSPEAEQAPKIKAAYSQAQQAVEATNIRTDEVLNAVEHLTGEARQKRLTDLAMDSKTRADLFAKLVDTFDQKQQLAANPEHLPLDVLAPRLQPLTVKYEYLKAQIDDTNLSAAEYDSILQEASSATEEQQKVGAQKLADLERKFADFPSRVKAMKEMDSGYKEYDKIKNDVSGAADLKHLLQGSGVLEFHILADSVTADPSLLQTMDARLAPGGKGPIPQPGDAIRWMEVDKIEEFDRPGAPPESHEWNGKHYMPVLVTQEASMTKASNQKWGLEHAYPDSQPNGTRAVGFNFNPAGASLFGDLTQHWYDKARSTGNPNAKSRLAIVLDNKIISAPSINTPITGGSGVIEGGQNGFSEQDLGYLITTMNAGSLPAQLSSEPISEQQVGPTLGADNLYRGLVACGFGLVVVAVFLVAYYYIAGIVAFFAVLMTVILILGTMAALNATFTLPSIAGIVLCVGTAVDANVLIFERLREEHYHKGLPLRMALRNSYAQASSAIIDSNMTSAITSLCLYMFGSEEVKGFGLTLLIGIVASLFTALYVTKTIFGIMIDRFGLRELRSLPVTFPKLDKALKPDWDWMGKAWIFYTFSIILIVTGLVLFTIKLRDGRMMDIEFASGTSLQFQLTQPMAQEDVRKLIDMASEKDPTALPSPSVVAVGTDELHYEVVSPNIDRQQVKDAVLNAMKGHLQIQLPTTYDRVDQDFTTALAAKTVLPIADASFNVDGFKPPAASGHIGGAALVLHNISPKLSAEQIRQRLDNERLSSSSTELTSIDFTVEAPGDASKLTDTAVVVAWNPSVSYLADESKWAEGLAQPIWKLAQDSLNRPPSFEKETNFDPQVAGQMQRDALAALAFSVIAIMVYIWVRFGNLRYGTATVVALLHDTIFTLAAMGFAHYIADYWHHNFLQVEPFRINLTVVAGILTIMGYSMIDTIVVFDRIRENRGKYGHLNREVINNAINQTLSRTLLTAGITIITVSFMYFLGGAGIHGFTFVLLIGILVGTYSSVAIAAPMLLWGVEKESVSQPPLGRSAVSQYRRAAV